MVGGNEMNQSIRTDIDRLRPFVEGHPLLAGLATHSRVEQPLYLTGGAVRDLLIGADITDYDLVAESGVAELATGLAHDALIHERFGTAELVVDGIRIDIATARRESYAHPGALPDVEPGGIEEDMGRRDFTINAMAVRLDEPETLIDPHGGEDDLRRGVLRVIHPGSFTDDPTRALRAARYSARFGFDLDHGTAELLAGVDLGTVSHERVEHELRLAAAEATGIDALRLISSWGLVEIPGERLELAAKAVSLLRSDTWRGRAERSVVVLEAAFGDSPELPVSQPSSPYAGVLLARGLRPAELILNRARGAEWLDLYENEWSLVAPAISGDDLVAAGLPQGPAIGVGLAAVLRAKLDEGLSGIEAELQVAVAAAEASEQED